MLTCMSAYIQTHICLHAHIYIYTCIRTFITGDLKLKEVNELILMFFYLIRLVIAALRLIR